MNVTALLIDAQQAHKRFTALFRDAKPWLMAGHRLVITIKPEGRTGNQNAALHAWIADIAASMEWAGAKRDVETWKRLLVAAWLRTRGESLEVLPALDGHGVDIVFRRTSSLTKAECAELLDFVQAWAAQNVPVDEPAEAAEPA
jgi:hypothetical protein